MALAVHRLPASHWNTVLTQGDAGKKWCFTEAGDESNHAESGARSHSRHANRADAPAEHHSRKKQARTDPSQPQIARKLSNEIANVEGGNASAPDGIGHVQIFLETCDSGVANIDTVQVAGRMLNLWQSGSTKKLT